MQEISACHTHPYLILKESEMSGIPPEWERKCKFAELMAKYPGNAGMAAGAYQSWFARRWAERISIWKRMETK
jgi:hypothetical protein